MAYRFEHDESIPRSVRRIIREQAKRAISELRPDHPDRHTGIHSARKSFKRSRSLLRLMKDDLGKRVYKQENRMFREAGLRLSEIRDAEAMIESYDHLAERYPEIMESKALRDFREKLVERRRRIARQEHGLEKSAADISCELRETLQRIDAWPLKRKSFSTVASGFKRSYRRGRKAFRYACSNESEEAFHEWRKRIKDYWYYCRLLQSCWPEFMDARSTELKVLEDLLGQDHDLAELQRILAGEADQPGNAASLLVCYTRERQTELRREARELGTRLYAGKPGVLVKAIRKHWKRWKSRS